MATGEIMWHDNELQIQSIDEGFSIFYLVARNQHSFHDTTANDVNRIDLLIHADLMKL